MENVPFHLFFNLIYSSFTYLKGLVVSFFSPLLFSSPFFFFKFLVLSGLFLVFLHLINSFCVTHLAQNTSLAFLLNGSLTIVVSRSTSVMSSVADQKLCGTWIGFSD